MTDAEVSAAYLLSKSEIAILEIQEEAKAGRESSAAPSSMVSEIRCRAESAITQGARQSISDIQREAKESIEKLKSHAAKATQEIRAIAYDVRTRISVNEAKAKEKFDNDKKQTRTTDSVAHDAKVAAEKVLSAAKAATDEIHVALESAIANIEAIVNESNKGIIDAAAKSEARITDARDKALARINEVVAMPSSHFPLQ